jgi:hypothetical protein
MLETEQIRRQQPTYLHHKMSFTIPGDSGNFDPKKIL